MKTLSRLLLLIVVAAVASCTTIPLTTNWEAEPNRAGFCIGIFPIPFQLCISVKGTSAPSSTLFSEDGKNTYD